LKYRANDAQDDSLSQRFEWLLYCNVECKWKTHIITFPEYTLSINRHKCEVLPQATKQSRGKLLPHSDLWGGVFLGETPHDRRYSEDYKQKQYDTTNSK
jgi:hypothetical protein